jgi:predicted HicB family RNase H-like nuclease
MKARRSDLYTYRITWSDEDGEYVGLCAEFPSLSWLAGTPEGALRGVRKLIRETLVDMDKQGENAPEPISSRRFSGKFLVRVPPDIHRKLALEAAEAGVSLNRVASAKLSG